jgi:UDP-4-amino-4,6-dideoxy-N-acetyl-beta-L-altrosamine transaminase
MPEKVYSYGRQLIEEDDVQAVVEALRSDRLTQGPRVHEFEKRLSEKLGAPYCSVVSSGTASLHLIALGLGWKPGDIVITSPMTFLATANCIVYAGATPDFADIDPLSYTLDPAKVEERILYHQSGGRKEKAVIGVDYAGQPCDWEGLALLAKRYDLQLLNDHCHALGSSYKGDQCFGVKYADAVSLGFHPVKHITTAEGGAAVTRHQWLDEKMKLLRTHGVTKDPQVLSKNDGSWYYEMIELGFNYRITDLQCALGISQLAKLDRFLRERRTIAAFYDAAFAGDGRFVTPGVRGDSAHAYHLYPLQIDFSKLSISKREFFVRLRDKGIQCQVHYVPLHLQPYYRDKYGYAAGDFPIAEEFYRREISIPLYPGLESNDLEYISSSMKDIAA